ncbi:carnitine O-palmitoyltransferase 1, liver isoform-like [Paramacrobiotus metropolitanus]|uniref:carnitine O-palmitoyltransferase 1, liver isoform-like n=1 Tax=Paramacrobiotus metropolitanus TaxID=2943436 RepID=UPI002445F8E6|nr:carnitine O-palmitoyltransferase 1, liver isoform-like [Paramacrobiotus metropolitanus]XP_055335543.1 carnitine O-palmitoyltransferase 1, liver isoform-like [Paramacrobiotus metropolitanus]XP_055335544.1 carnitine O-palmitoyltransferase 1, liver isoform-like [Paramacrobiotus metropolitanus]XP_055335545.1 carnitine O-palmitoyltransferase 1, liver isoform-like [Paramacrobiotus metropolitanus]
MAEAHLAVAFQFNVTHEGVRVDYDQDLVREILHTYGRSWRYRLVRFLNNIKNVVFPFTLSSATAVIVLTSALAVTDPSSYLQQLGFGKVNFHFDPTFGYAQKLATLTPWKLFGPSKSVIISAVTISTAEWVIIIFAIRWMTQLLLSYRGALFERRGRYSLKTKLWFILMKLLQGKRKPLLYSYQGMMPILPLPSLKETMTRYLRSVRPLLDDANYERMEKLAKEFQNGVGRKFQRYLFLKWMVSTNYVSDWWEQYVYLRNRSALMINSNFYAMDSLHMPPTTRQASRAANLIYNFLTFRRMLVKQDVNPLLLDGTIPLCSWQYMRSFDTCRIPGVETDKVDHYYNSTHVVVLHKGRFFKVYTHGKGRLLNPKELEMQIERVIHDTSPAQPGEQLLCAMTAVDRAPWAQNRRAFFNRGVNRVSLETIERAAFFVALDDEEHHYDKIDPSHLDAYCKWLLHGNGHNRWYDKSFNLIVMKNAKAGLNVEHSWADAPVIGHAWEWVITEDLVFLGYTADGHCKGSVEVFPTPPQRLRFELPDECLKFIEDSALTAKLACDDVDLRILTFNEFGKGFVKGCKVSPDAFVQMALQLAYYRDAGKFNLTYEASMTRLFREGRTETVRPCTVESCAFVRAMLDEKATNFERQRLLRTACDVHQQGYLNAMCGRGIDRHLFCLYVVSKYLDIDTPFLKEILSEPWRLSTSQTPQTQTGRVDVNKYPDQVSPGGGFGPVADDGYGVSYIISGENCIFFHISSKASSPKTDSDRFRGRIRQAMLDMRSIFDTPTIVSDAGK